MQILCVVLLLLKTMTSKQSYLGITFRVAPVIVSTEESHEHCKGLTYQQQHKAQKTKAGKEADVSDLIPL